MTLETIQESIKIAMKTHATLEVEVLRAVVAAVKKAAIDKRCEITEELVNEMLLKEQKIIREMIDTCPKDREELLDEYEHRLMIVDNFAPKLVTDEAQITHMVVAALTQAGIDPATVTNKGQIMKTVMPQLKGKVDMKIANQVISKYIK